MDYLIVTALLCVTDVSAWKEVDAIRDISFWNNTNSRQELDVVSQFSDRSSALWSRELRKKASETSLVTTVSTCLQPPSRLYGAGMPTPGSSRSMWYTDTPTIKDSLKALLQSTPNSSTDAVQHPGALASHTPVKGPIPGLRSKPSLFSQPSRPSTSTSCTSCTSTTSSFMPEPSELSRSLDHHLPQQSPFGLDNKESSSSEQQPNASQSTDTLNGSESYRRPLPKPPRELALRRTKSSIPSRTRTIRPLPPTPLLEVSEPNESRSSVLDDGHIHSQSSPMKKVSPELTQWVLSTTPSPATVVFDLPPSYSSIYFAKDDKLNSITTPTTSTSSS